MVIAACVAACGGDVCCASSCTAGLPLLLLTAERKKDIGDDSCRLCHLCLLHHQTQQTILSSRETRVHVRGVRRAAVGCLGLSRLSLRVAAGVNCASVLGGCHTSTPLHNHQGSEHSERSPLLSCSSLPSELCINVPES